jgi:RecG-like helicase
MGPLRRLTAGRDALHAAELQAEMLQVGVTAISDCADREVVDLAGVLRTVTQRPRGATLTMAADLWDGTGHVTLVWLGRRSIPGIQPGRRVVVRGRVARIKGERTIFNPVYKLQPVPSSPEPPVTELPRP